MSVYLWPPVSVTTIPPVGGATSANQVLQLAEETSINSKLPALVGGKIPVLSTDQVQTGSFDEDQSVSTTPETFTAPAGAFACFIEADDTNTTNARIVMGGVSSSTSGIQFQAGRSEFYQGGSNISYCMESGTGKLSVQWFIKS